MSWNSIESMDKIKADFCLEQGQKITMIWVCPRCGKTQTEHLDLDELFNTELYCENTKVCGEGQVYFELDITITEGRYKGLNDRPLE